VVEAFNLSPHMFLEVRGSNIHGKGVFTTVCIPKHSLIGRINILRKVTDESPLDSAKGELEHHCHWYPDGTMVLVGEPHRFPNHSCNPNTFTYGVAKVIYLMAMREIQRDEESTLWYCVTNSDGQVWACNCRSPDYRDVTGVVFGT
jgi:hypothetical protein